MQKLLLLYLVGLAVYGALAGPRLAARPPHEHIALAEALLNGRLDIDASLASSLDLAAFGGRFFVPYPPTPAALAAPLVALAGRKVHHGILHVALAAAILPAFYLALRRFTSETEHGERERLWLAGLLAFGTPVAALAVNSNVYFTGQIAAVVFSCLYLAAAWRGRQPGWAGLALGVAFLSRSAVVLAFPIVLAEIWRARPPRAAGAPFRESRLGAAGRFAAGLGALVALAGLYNWLRFGNPLDFGYSYLGWRNDPVFARWGLFSLAYLERNLHAALTSLPVLLPAFPFLTFNPEGLSLLITTPVLAVLPFLRGWTPTARAALLASGLIFLTALLYANTGFAQYGYRYAADFLPFLILGMALAGLRVVSWPIKALILFGVAVSLWGAAHAGWYPLTAELELRIRQHTLLRYR